MELKLRLTNKYQTPPGGWRYRVEALADKAPELVWCGPTHTYPDLYKMVLKRCEANGITPPSEEQFEDQICQHVPPEFCVDSEGRLNRAVSKFAVMSSTFKQGTKTLYSWWLHGRRRVSVDEIVRRTYICNQCPENRAIEQCSACAMKNVHAIVNEIVANTRLKTDDLLKACAVCQCSLIAKVRLPLEDLLPNIPKNQYAQLPTKCWLRDSEPKVGSDILT